MGCLIPDYPRYKMINDQAPFGVVEVKSGGLIVTRSAAMLLPPWRAPYHNMSLLRFQFVMGTAAAPRAGPVAFFRGNSRRNPGGMLVERYPD